MSLQQFIAAQFRRPSGWFGSWALAPLMNAANRKVMEDTLRLLEPQPGHQVLEVGFGGGYALSRLMEILGEGKVTGVDFAPDMVRQARRRFRKEIASGRVRVELGDVSSLDFAPETFDRVLTINTIYFWPDALAGLGEIRRVLRPGGRAAVSIRSKATMAKVSFTRHGFRLFSPEEVADLMRQAGFREVAVDHRDRQRLYDQGIIVGTR